MPRLSMNEKVNLISFDRELMNEKVSKSIMLNLNSMVATIRNLKLDAITHAKAEKAINMLEELTYKLFQTDDIDVLINRRNRINYYINRIKTLTNVSDVKFDDSLFLFRDDIKEYVRIFKRNDTIKKLIKTDVTSLSKEDKKVLTSELSKEKRFNQRLTEKYNNERVITRKPSKGKETSVSDKFEYDELVIKEEEIKEVTSGNINFAELVEEKEEVKYNNIPEGTISFDKIEAPIEKTSYVAAGTISFDKIKIEAPEDIKVADGDLNFDFIEEPSANIYRENYSVEGNFEYEDVTRQTLIDAKENIYINQNLIDLINNYKIVRTNKYEKNIFKNIKNLINNIPGYLRNKKAVKKMEKDYSQYSQGRDLFKLIKYTKYDSSFKYALGEILRFKSANVKKAARYRQVLESIYNSLVILPASPEDFKILLLQNK